MIKLIGVLVAGIPAIISGILALMTRKAVTVTASFAALIAVTVAFIATINGIVGTLASHLTGPAWIANAVGMFIPSDFGACIGAIVSAHIARAAYDLAVEKTRLFNAAS